MAGGSHPEAAATDPAEDAGVTDVWTAIRTKRMVRELRGPAARCRSTSTRILDAGRHAGSSKNLQRWDFIVVEDRAHPAGALGVGPFAGHVAGAAAAVALVTPDPTRRAPRSR